MRLQERYTLLLDAGHGEYIPSSGVVLSVWAPLDFDEPFEYDEDKAALLMRAALPDEAREFECYDPSWCTVITLSGTPGQLESAFSELLAQVSAEPSGDDDTFDYWPSGGRLLLALAVDLDVLAVERGDENQGSEAGHLERAQQAIEEVLDAKGDLADELRDKFPEGWLNS
jgi:hypothetical protein